MDVFRVDFYTLIHIFKKKGQVINAALFMYVLQSIKELYITFIVNKHNFSGKEINILRSVALM